MSDIFDNIQRAGFDVRTKAPCWGVTKWTAETMYQGNKSAVICFNWLAISVKNQN